MKKLYLRLLTLMGLLCSINASADLSTLQLQTGTILPYAEESIPVKSITTDSTKLVVDYELISALVEDDHLYEGSKWLRIPTFGLSVEEGTPSLPFRIDTYELPIGCDSVTITGQRGVFRSFSMELTPSRPLLVDSGDGDWTKNNVKPVRSSSFKTSREVAKIVGYEKYRGRTRVRVKISPVQYDLATRTIRVYYHFQFRINCIMNPNQAKAKELARSYNIFPGVLDTVNVSQRDSAILDLSRIPTRYSAQYAVLTTPKYLDAAKTFASHKSVLGYDMSVYTKNVWTEKQVKDSLQKFYDENDNPMYALIIGGHGDVPAQKIRYYSNENDTVSYTDYRYACMDGHEDMVQDFYIGRIPVKTLAEANVVVNKIKNYEMAPPIVPTFYQNALHVSFFEKYTGNFLSMPAADKPRTEMTGCVYTSEEIRDYMLTQGKNVERIYTTDSPSPKYWNPLYCHRDNREIPMELQNLNFYNCSAQDIADSFNSGRFYVLHRNHGQVDGWSEPSFCNGDIDKLRNSNKLPVVFSINCQSGNFAEYNGGVECFAEKMLKHPNGGGVAVIASSHVSYSGLNDELSRSIFNLMWPNPGLGGTMDTIQKNPRYELGSILGESKEYLTTIYEWNDTQLKMTLDRFHIFGDPSMMVRNEVPLDFSDSEFTVDANGFSVNCNEPVYVAVKNAQTGKSIIYYGKQFRPVMSIITKMTKFYGCIYGPNRIPRQFEYGVIMPGVNNGMELMLKVSNDNSANKLRVAYALPEISECAEMQVNNIFTGASMGTHIILSNEASAELDTSSYENGYYVVTVRTGDGQTAQDRFAVIR